MESRVVWLMKTITLLGFARGLFAVVCVAAVGIALLSAPPARAGGAQLWELGTPDVGLAAAGWAARAQDASTLFKNPAGMNLLETPQIEAGLQGMYGHFEFESGSDTTVSGDGGGNAVGFMPGGSLFWVQPLGDVVAVGIGVFAYVASALDYDDDFVGRYHVDKTALIGFSFMPAVSFRIADWLTLGAGFNIMLGLYDFEMAVNNPEPTLDDGRLALSDSDVGFGANIGVLFSVSEGTRVGLTYLSPVKLDFVLPTDFTGLGPTLTDRFGDLGLLDTDLEANLTVPQSLVLSVYQDLSLQWALMGNVGWQDWSNFGLIGIDLDSTRPEGVTADRNYQDTFHVAIGTRFRPISAWALSMGFAYDSSAVSDEERTLDAPMGQAFRMGAGAEWLVVPAVAIGLAYEFVWFGDMAVDQSGGPLMGDVAGRFDGAALHVLALSLQWNIGAQPEAASTTSTAHAR